MFIIAGGIVLLAVTAVALRIDGTTGRTHRTAIDLAIHRTDPAHHRHLDHPHRHPQRRALGAQNPRHHHHRLDRRRNHHRAHQTATRRPTDHNQQPLKPKNNNTSATATPSVNPLRRSRTITFAAVPHTAPPSSIPLRRRRRPTTSQQPAHSRP